MRANHLTWTVAKALTLRALTLGTLGLGTLGLGSFGLGCFGLGCFGQGTLEAAPVAAAAPGASGWDAPSTPSTETAGQPCASLMFVGVRGSGEQAPFGTTVDLLRQELGSRLTNDVRVVHLDYPAVSPHTLGTEDLQSLVLTAEPPQTQYFDSVETGRRRLVELLSEQSASCPGQGIVLAGFSQGAESITHALGSGAETRNLLAALLVGNPAHYPGQNVQELDQQIGTPAIGLDSTLVHLRRQAQASPQADHRTAVHHLIEGVFDLHEGKVGPSDLAASLRQGGGVVPASLYPKVFSVCRPDDMVCDATPALNRLLTSSSTLEQEFERARPVHGAYHPDHAVNSIDEIVRIVESQPSSRTSGRRRAVVLPSVLAAGVAVVVLLGLYMGRRVIARRSRA